MRGAPTLSFPLGYKAAHHWPARLVVQGMWDTMEVFVPCHLAVKHSLTQEKKGGLLQKGWKVIKNEESQGGSSPMFGERSNDDAWKRTWKLTTPLPSSPFIMILSLHL